MAVSVAWLAQDSLKVQTKVQILNCQLIGWKPIL